MHKPALLLAEFARDLCRSAGRCFPHPWRHLRRARGASRQEAYEAHSDYCLQFPGEILHSKNLCTCR
jgi:hypothetical protein